MDTQPTTSAMKRALNEAKEALASKGFEMVPIKFSDEDIKEAGLIYRGLILNYHIGPIMENLYNNYEEPMPSYKYSMILYRSNFIIRGLFLGIIKLTGNNRLFEAAKTAKPLPQTELNRLLKRQKELMLKMKGLWNDWNIEAILQPSYVSVAFKHEHAPDMGVFIDYLNFWSLFHYPAGIVPVSKTNLEEENGEDYLDNFNDKWTKVTREDIKASANLPLSVTIVARPWEDEIVCGVMKALDETIKFRMNPPLIE